MPKMSKEARQNQIITGAILAFATHGYARATIQKIALAASITPGLIHYHFPTKEQILIGVLEHLSHVITQRFEALHDHHASLDALIEAYVGMSQGTQTEAIDCWVAIATEALHLPEVQAPFEKAILHQRDAIAHALIDDERLDEGTALEVAAAIVAMIQGSLILSRTTHNILPKGFAARQLRAAARGMIFAHRLNTPL